MLVHNGTPNSRHLYGPVAAAASLASLAPVDTEGLDWFAGMGQENVDDFLLMARDKEAAWAELETDREAILTTPASEQSELIKTLLSPTDAAALTGELAEYLAYMNKEALAPGGQGWWDDGIAHGGPWGFELSNIRVPVLVVHGRQDQFVPFAHGQWLAAHIPGAEARLLDEDGHLTLIANHVGEVHAWLADRLLPHLPGLRPRLRGALEHVAMARPGPVRPQ